MILIKTHLNVGEFIQNSKIDNVPIRRVTIENLQDLYALFEKEFVLVNQLEHFDINKV